LGLVPSIGSAPYLDLTGGYEDDGPGIHEIAHQKVDELVNNYKPTVGGKVQAAIKDFFLKKYQNKKVADL